MSRNVVDARWVTTWKMNEGNVGGGCKDKFQHLGTYVGTISRPGQRCVNVVAAEDEDFILFSFDVSQAFANVLTFEEFSKLIGTGCRAAQFDVPRLDL